MSAPLIKKTLVWLSIMLLITGCSGEKTAVTSSADDVLVLAQSNDPVTLDPHQGNDGSSLRVNKQIYSRLIEVTGDLEITPGLAKEWRQIDPVTTEFHLRKGVKFHNGEELTASDVKFSIKRMQDSSRIAFVLPPIESIDIVDDYTVRVVTPVPFGPLMAHLSHPALSILNQKEVEKWGDKYHEHPSGTGPYRFASWDRGNSITLERFDDYFMKPAAFKKLVFHTVVEGSSRTMGLKTGELDVVLDLPPVDVELVDNNPELKVLKKPSLLYNYLGFNNQKGLFKNRDLRLAINYAINTRDIVDAALDGAGTIATSVIAPGVIGYTPQAGQYRHNQEKARAYLKKSGLEEGAGITLTISDNGVHRQVAEVIQSQLREIGINVVIDAMENSAFLERTHAGDFDMFISSWGCVTGDADYGLYAMFHSDAHGSFSNRVLYSNTEVDRLLDKGKTALDPEERQLIYARIQKKIIEDAPHVPLYQRTLLVGAQKEIEGLNPHPVTLHDLYPVHRSAR